MPDVFTDEEVNLMCIFDTSSRDNLISELNCAIGGFEDEMLEIAVSVLRRLSEMNDADFAALELYPDYDNYDESEV